eukprot:5069005-Amphidinium_carterae.1
MPSAFFRAGLQAESGQHAGGQVPPELCHALSRYFLAVCKSCRRFFLAKRKVSPEESRYRQTSPQGTLC